MPDVQASTAAEGGGGIASELMAPNPGTMIWVWVIFVVLLVLLHKFAWKPILASVAERERKLKESLSRAEEVAAMAASSETEQQRILTEARVEATRILSEQRDFASKFRAQAESEAKASAERIVGLAKTEIDAAAQQAAARLRRDAAELSVEVAERILRHKLEGAESAEFAERLMSEVAKN